MPAQELRKTLQELQIELEKLNFENDAHKDKVNQSLAEGLGLLDIRPLVVGAVW